MTSINVEYIPNAQKVKLFWYRSDRAGIEGIAEWEDDFAYVCWDCGKANNFWVRMCAECDARADSEGWL
jgi:hypothetical protein